MSNNQQDNMDYLSQTTEVEIVIALIPYLTQRTFVDIGAEKGTFSELFVSHGLSGVLFEPLAKHAAILKEIEQRTGTTFFTYAIDATDHEASFHIACDENNNPLDYFHSLQKISNDSRVQHKISIPVTCKSLNTLLHEGHISKNIGVLKTDTEGNDLNVMKGMSEISAEVLICEYFMPGVYDGSGWELGHPAALIAEAKKLGFNHFVSIKRIQQFEIVSMDNDHFVDGQWGNLVFMTDDIFSRARGMLNNLMGSKEVKMIKHVISEFNTLHDICKEREALIHDLHNECERRLNIINSW